MERAYVHDCVDRVSESQVMEKSPDGEQIALLCDKSHVHLSRADSGEFVRKFRGISFGDIAFSHDSTLLATRSILSRDISIWPVATNGCIQILKNRGGLAGPASFSHDSSLNALVVSYGKVAIHHARNGECVNILIGNETSDSLQEMPSPCFAIFSPDSAFVAAVSCPDTICLWRTRLGTCIRTINLDLRGTLMPISFSQHSKLMACIDNPNGIRIWRAKTGQDHYRFPIGDRKRLASVVCSHGTIPDLHYVVFGGKDRDIERPLRHREPTHGV